MADVKWIKISTDIFNDEKIAIIEGMPDADADSIIIIWFKLLCLAGRQNNSGVFVLNDEMPFTDEMFAAIFRRPIASVRKALNVFQSLGMIEVLDNVVTIPNWEKHQSIDKLNEMRAASRESSKRYREKQKLLSDVTVMSPSSHGDGIEEDKEIDKEKDSSLKEEEEEQSKQQNKKQINKIMYGTYRNVPLTTEELNDLKQKCVQWDYYINRISEVMYKNKKTYDDIISTILKWYTEDKAKGKWKNDITTPASYDLSEWEKKDLARPVYQKKKKQEEDYDF